jgi:predicted metal-dependent hydrolase
MGKRTRTEVTNSCPTEDALAIPNKHNLPVSMSDEWPEVHLTEAIVRNHVGRDNQIGDYVIVHELLHFSIPNHGKLWKSLMRAHLGAYDRAEEELQNNQCSTC